MDGWHIALISVAVPALITAGLPYLSAHSRRRQAGRLTDAEFGLKIRDELRADNERLRQWLTALEAENGELRRQVASLNGRVVRLEAALRRHGHANEIEEAG